MERTRTQRRFVAMLGVSLVSLAVGTVSAQAIPLYTTHPVMGCRAQHVGAVEFCTAVEHRKAIRILRVRELRQARRVHVRFVVRHHRLPWNPTKLKRAAHWHRHNLRHLQSMPTWEPSEPVPLGHMLAAQAGWTDANGQWSCLYSLWNRESGWTTPDTNASSGAAGIPQALPASKMGAGWDETNGPNGTGGPTLRALKIQILWGLGYIRARYGTPCAAWAHSNAFNYY